MVLVWLASAAIRLPGLLRHGRVAACASSWSALNSPRPIGYVHSPWSAKFGCPRQGSLAPDARASLTLLLPDGLSAVHALEGLDEYSHVWLLWAFNQNSHSAANSKVRVPRLRGGRAGLFATRTPYRPNPIGLSLVRLVGVSGNTLQLSGVDLVDGTPVLDVKPYVSVALAHEITMCPLWPIPLLLCCRQVPQYDAPADPVRVAPWVPAGASSLEVVFSPAASSALDTLRGTLLDDNASLRRTLVQSLESDPRPVYRWRRERGAGAAEYELQVDGITAQCRFERSSEGEERVLVVAVHAVDADVV